MRRFATYLEGDRLFQVFMAIFFPPSFVLFSFVILGGWQEKSMMFRHLGDFFFWSDPPSFICLAVNPARKTLAE